MGALFHFGSFCEVVSEVMELILAVYAAFDAAQLWRLTVSERDSGVQAII